jgi:hypothetical protein
MKLIDAAKQEAKIARLGEWRPWFAWHPVYDQDTGDLVWWEPMQRRTEFLQGPDGTYSFDYYRRPGARSAAEEPCSEGVNPKPQSPQEAP